VVYDFYPTIPIDKPKKYGLRGELQQDNLRTTTQRHVIGAAHKTALEEVGGGGYKSPEALHILL
jgi:hypothetical protein